MNNKTIISILLALLSSTASAQIYDVSEVPRLIGGMTQPLFSCGCSVNHPQRPYYNESLPGVSSWEAAAARCHELEGKALAIGANRRRGTGASAVVATLACEPKAMSKDSMLEMNAEPSAIGIPTEQLNALIKQAIDDHENHMEVIGKGRGRGSETIIRYEEPPKPPFQPYWDNSPNDGVPQPKPKSNPGLTR